MILIIHLFIVKLKAHEQILIETWYKNQHAMVCISCFFLKL